MINLRTLLASDLLGDDHPDLTRSGRHVQKHVRALVQQLIEIFKEKDGQDQLQDLLWYLSRSKVSVNVDRLPKSAAQLTSQARYTAFNQSLRTVGSLLLTNSDFRLFLKDLGLISRKVFADTATSLSGTAEEAAEQIKLSPNQQGQLIETAKDNEVPTSQELTANAAEVAEVVSTTIAATSKDAVQSVQENLSGDQRGLLLQRLKTAASKLRQRPDYNQSVSTISKLLQDYLIAFSRIPRDAVDEASRDIDTNAELNAAVQKSWDFASTFGDVHQWNLLRDELFQLKEQSTEHPEFEKLVEEISNTVKRLLSDPDFLDNPEKALQRLQDKAMNLEKDSPLSSQVKALILQVSKVWHSVLDDSLVNKLMTTILRLADCFSPTGELVNTDLLQDALHIFGPLIIQAIQYVPIIRFELSVPEVDLLLENFILEPGSTVNHSSFFPFKMRIQAFNDLEIRKTHTEQVTASNTTSFRVTLEGISVKAADFGYWLRLKQASNGFFTLSDSGIASFALDDRGIDIALDVEVGKEKLESILTLRKVRVKVHHFDYTLRKSSISWLAWLAKPILAPILRRLLEKNIATAIADFFHATNRELLFARERLRATRISDPDDLMTFVKAVMTRLVPDDDPDTYIRMGVNPPKTGTFKNLYAPGSLVKLWEEEALEARERVEDGDQDGQGWKNEIFDLKNTRSVPA